MQHNLPKSPCDLDPRPKTDLDLSGSSCICFWQENRSDVRFISLAAFDKKVVVKIFFFYKKGNLTSLELRLVKLAKNSCERVGPPFADSVYKDIDKWKNNRLPLTGFTKYAGSSSVQVIIEVTTGEEF